MSLFNAKYQKSLPELSRRARKIIGELDDLLAASTSCTDVEIQMVLLRADQIPAWHFLSLFDFLPHSP